MHSYQQPHGAMALEKKSTARAGEEEAGGGGERTRQDAEKAIVAVVE